MNAGENSETYIYSE